MGRKKKESNRTQVDVNFNLRVDVFNRLAPNTVLFTNNSNRHIPSYPYLHRASDGGGRRWTGNEPSRYNHHPATGTFVDGPDVEYPPMHFDGSAVVYDGVAGKNLMVGGFDGTLPFHRIKQLRRLGLSISPDPAQPVWKASAAMTRGRNMHMPLFCLTVRCW